MTPTQISSRSSSYGPSDSAAYNPQAVAQDVQQDSSENNEKISSRTSDPTPTMPKDQAASTASSYNSGPTLMTLPSELLLQILTFIIPNDLTKSTGKLNGRPYHNHPSHRNPPTPIFRTYHATTLVSHRFHNLSRTAFFDTYTHELSLDYSPSRDCACDEGCEECSESPEIASLSPREFQRRDVRKMTVSVSAYFLGNLRIAVEGLPKQLGRFTGVREVEVSVDTWEHSSRVHALAERLWREMKLTFECHDQRVRWDKMGAKQVEDLKSHLSEDELELEELATAL
ncbi:hypothetical protein LTR17_000712 [Elasticomyces elasticus]|nr:hypothetical protein LTR17_000712 [Elasticomyces elasticus]